jgi:hypothetical protein
VCRKYQSRLCGIALVAALTLGSGAIAGAWPHRDGQIARVQFVATSNLFRTTWGMNEDSFLAVLAFRKSGEKVLVRLIDSYPNRFAPLTHAVLQSQEGTDMRVKRDVECDRTFGEIKLRTAPGDLMAILPEQFSYKLQLRHYPSRTQPYRVTG